MTRSFADYGIRDDSVPADDALLAMLADPATDRIIAESDLRFDRRHVLRRGNITLDFQHHRVRAPFIEDAAHDDPFSAILYFAGTRTPGPRHTLTAPHDELSDLFEVPDASFFALHAWCTVHVESVGAREEKEIDKLLQVIEIVDATHVRFNYKMGWPLQAGRVLHYDPTVPVENVRIQDMVFLGNPEYPDDDRLREQKGVSPVCFTHAVGCDVSGIEAYYVYWPVILRRHNAFYVTEHCRLINPVEVIVGGTGYLTQQIHCLYGEVRHCQTSRARHLNDFTGSAYCLVSNCHADGDYHGGFVTHGQFEHDLTYLGNSGILSFANSGPTWGESARRIAVRKHYGSWVIAPNRITDLTLEDVEARFDPAYPQSGTFLLNADGVQARGCVADRGAVFTQRCKRSRRPNVIDGCSFGRDREVTIVTEGDRKVVSPILFRD